MGLINSLVILSYVRSCKFCSSLVGFAFRCWWFKFPPDFLYAARALSPVAIVVAQRKCIPAIVGNECSQFHCIFNCNFETNWITLFGEVKRMCVWCLSSRSLTSAKNIVRSWTFSGTIRLPMYKMLEWLLQPASWLYTSNFWKERGLCKTTSY